MIVVVALRKTTDSLARQFLAEQACEIHKSRFDGQEPALRNLIDGLYRQGIQAEQQADTLFWYLVEAPVKPEQWLGEACVAVCFCFEWYEQQTTEIRYLKGVAYCDAAASWAKLLPINGLAAHTLQTTGRIDWRGRVIEKDIQPNVNLVEPLRSEVEKATAEKIKTNCVHIDTPVLMSQFEQPTVVSIAAQPNMVEESNTVAPAISRINNRKLLTKKVPATIAEVVIDEERIANTETATIVLTAATSEPKKRGRPRKNPSVVLTSKKLEPKTPASEVVELVTLAPIMQSTLLTDANVEQKNQLLKDLNLPQSASLITPKKRGRPRKPPVEVIVEMAVDLNTELDEEQLDLFV